MVMDPVQLVREENGYKRWLLVDVSQTNGMYYPMATPQLVGKNKSVLEEPVVSLKDVKPAMKKLMAKLSKEGWKEKLDAGQLARIKARQAEFPSNAIERKLATAIAKPANVTSLDLRGKPGNTLTFLPPTIKSLTKLRVLILDHNEIEMLPPEFEQLKALEYFSIARNKLIDMRPASSLKKLRLLNVHGNQIDQNYAGAVQKDFEIQMGGNKDMARIGSFKATHTVGIDTDSLYPLDDDRYEEKAWKSVKRLHIYGRDLVPIDRKNVLKRFPNAEIKWMGYADNRARPKIPTEL